MSEKKLINLGEKDWIFGKYEWKDMAYQEHILHLRD